MNHIELNTKLGGEGMQELFYGSLEERELLATVITNKGVNTNVSDTLVTMAENIEKIPEVETDSGSVSFNIGSNGASATQHVNFKITFSKTPTVGITNPWTYFSVNTIKNVSTTGFDIEGKNNGSATHTFNWIAIAK